MLQRVPYSAVPTMVDHQRVSSLHRVDRLRIDLQQPIFQRYSSMKLGVEEDVAHYACMLASLVAQVIRAIPNHEEWVLTSPGYNVIPAAANLLCSQTYSILRGSLPPTVRLERIDIREQRNYVNYDDRKNIREYRDYSKLDVSQRRLSRDRSMDFVIKDASFRHRHVIFVNDINVTGAQQHAMSRYFAELETAMVQWIYVIDVDNAIARSNPQIEHTINNLNLRSFDDFLRVVVDQPIQFTSKCIWRMFSYSLDELSQLFAILDDVKKTQILKLAVQEGLCHVDCFGAKIEALRADLN